MAMLAIKRARILLNRDIVFVATADEEMGGKLGAGWVVDHQPNLYRDAGYVLNEGGGVRTDQAGHRYYSVAITEKSPLWLRLTATAASGHAASPPDHTAVTRLIKALDKLDDYQPPIKVLPVVEDYFHRLAVIDQDQSPSPLLDLRKALEDPAFEKQFISVPHQNAMVRDTLTPTVVNAGYKTNIIPATASAELDCRLFPDEDPKAFTKVVRDLIGDDKIKIEQLLNFSTLASPERSELMNAIVTLARHQDQDAPVIPALLTGFNDSHYSASMAWWPMALCQSRFRSRKVTQFTARTNASRSRRSPPGSSGWWSCSASWVAIEVDLCCEQELDFQLHRIRQPPPMKQSRRRSPKPD